MSPTPANWRISLAASLPTSRIWLNSNAIVASGLCDTAAASATVCRYNESSLAPVTPDIKAVSAAPPISANENLVPSLASLASFITPAIFSPEVPIAFKVAVVSCISVSSPKPALSVCMVAATAAAATTATATTEPTTATVLALMPDIIPPMRALPINCPVRLPPEMPAIARDWLIFSETR